MINHLYNKQPEKLYLNFSDTIMCNCTKRGKHLLEIISWKKKKKKSTFPHAYLNYFESLMTDAVFPGHPISWDMVIIDTFLKVVTLENNLNM